MPIPDKELFFGELTERLKGPLPGSQAHRQMTAHPRGGRNIDFYFEDEPRESSVLIVLFEKNGKLMFPLIQRPQYTGVHSGQIGLPGGKSEQYDKTRIDTALRETEEEIGIAAGDIRILGILTELYVKASHYNVVPVVGYLPYVPSYVPDPKEVSRVIECDVQELVKEENRKVKELLVRHKYRITAPYFDIHNEIVWGATAMILSEFVAVLNEILN